jgi:hypothetical protein
VSILLALLGKQVEKENVTAKYWLLKKIEEL